MSQPITIDEHLITADILTAEEVAEHQRLTKLIELAESPAPLTIAQIAELAGLTPQRVRQIEQLALYKAKSQIVTKHPELLKPITKSP